MTPSVPPKAPRLADQTKSLLTRFRPRTSIARRLKPVRSGMLPRALARKQAFWRMDLGPCVQCSQTTLQCPRLLVTACRIPLSLSQCPHGWCRRAPHRLRLSVNRDAEPTASARLASPLSVTRVSLSYPARARGPLTAACTLQAKSICVCRPNPPIFVALHAAGSMGMPTTVSPVPLHGPGRACALHDVLTPSPLLLLVVAARSACIIGRSCVCEAGCPPGFSTCDRRSLARRVPYRAHSAGAADCCC